MKEHPKAEILRAIADGKTVQMRRKVETGPDYDWWESANVLQYINDESREFRIKPETITINGREVPEPVREPLEDGIKYFLVDINNQELAAPDVWRGGEADNLWLKRGLIHLTKEAAIAHAEALLSFTRSDK